ncbi:MAG: glycine cleavage system protein GcvH [Chloroflexota bacterium]
MNILSELKYTKSDEWIKVEGSTGIIGISDYAQNALSDIIFIELPGVGETLVKGEMYGTVESVKAASDVNMPVGGEVIEVNEALTQKTELVNSDPYGQAWMIKIKIADENELNDLMDAQAYQKYCEEREK